MKHHLICVTLAISLVSTVGIVQADLEVVASWTCLENTYPKPTNPIVRTWIYADSGTGKIEANGIVKDASYSQQGLEHRWNFDPNIDEEDYDASFVIDPSGTGKYYYFGSEDSVKPSLWTECTKTK